MEQRSHQTQPHSIEITAGLSLIAVLQATLGYDVGGSADSKGADNSGWRYLRAAHGEAVPFSFETRGKMRHTNSHDVKVHQLIVKVDGWQQVSPVSVDRVGTYFRHALPVRGSNLPPARVVVEVKLEGSARKLVSIRSALVVRNTLPYDVQLRLVNSPFKVDGTLVTPLKKSTSNICFSSVQTVGPTSKILIKGVF